MLLFCSLCFSSMRCTLHVIHVYVLCAAASARPACRDRGRGTGVHIEMPTSPTQCRASGTEAITATSQYSVVDTRMAYIVGVCVGGHPNWHLPLPWHCSQRRTLLRSQGVHQHPQTPRASSQVVTDIALAPELVVLMLATITMPCQCAGSLRQH